MPLISMKEMLKDAQKNNYAIGSFNAINLDMARGVIAAAEAENSPVIICHAEVHFKYTPLEKIAPILINEAEKADVPVAVLLDHGKSFSSILKAMDLGFNAIMFDGSRLSFEENIDKTREIVKIARSLDVSVEAELGHVSRPEGGGAEDDEEAAKYEHEGLHTIPAEASEFVNKTGVDCLAVAFGTAHGLYQSEPELDFARLEQLKNATEVPLVMHGGSGLSPKEFKKSINNGICKVNYYTGMAFKATNVIKEKLNQSEENVYYHDLMCWGIEAFKEDVRETLKLFGSNNQA